MRALEEAKIKVPEEIAMVGAGAIHYGDMLRVPLTTVSWSKTDMGQQAAQLLLMLIDRKGTASSDSRPKHIVLEPELIVRRSCGAA
jgi:LacI family transcriptional regulator